MAPRIPVSKTSSSPTEWRRRAGQTLLELIVATALIAAALVPALLLMRDGMEWGRQIETRNLMAIFCDAELEKQLNRASADWTPGTSTGNYAAEGHSTLRYATQASDAASDGGIADRLMAVTVTVWNDENANGALDASEQSVVMRSKISKLAGYEAESSN